MTATLHLTTAEQKLFSALPAALTKGCAIEEEKLAFADTPEKMEVRMRNLELHDPALIALKDSAHSIKSQADFEKLAAGIDFEKVNPDDLMELYFAMGPDALSAFIDGGLKQAKSADDITALTALSTIRHVLLQSLTGLSS